MATSEKEEKSKSISYSQYSIYKSCPHQWYLTYVKKHAPFTSNIHTVFGTAMHETLQHYLHIMFSKSVVQADKIHLPTFFKKKLIEVYEREAREGHFSTPEELSEFYQDGVAILEFFKKKRGLYFTKKNTQLIGIEIPLNGFAIEDGGSIKMKGFIDLITYDKVLKRYTIYDIKTSTRGWSDAEKKNQIKVNQILFYKRFFSILKKVPEDSIDVKFFIVRRKIVEEAEFPTKRVQEFIPAHGTRKVESAIQDLREFAREAFNPDGSPREKAHLKNPSSCRFCPYAERADLCDKKNS